MGLLENIVMGNERKHIIHYHNFRGKVFFFFFVKVKDVTFFVKV